MDDLTLQKCIIALAARHFANAGQSFDRADAIVSPRFVGANLDALYFKKQTIEGLSRALSRQNHAERDSLMATILLLIFLDLLESGIEGWSYHLRGAKGLINISRSVVDSDADRNRESDTQDDPGDTAKNTRQFIARQFSLYVHPVHRTKGFMLFRLTNTSISTFGDALSGPQLRSDTILSYCLDRNQESIVRSFLGCPEILQGAIRYFSSQRDLLESMHLRVIDNNGQVRDTIAMLDMTARFDCLEWASKAQITTVSSVEIQNLSLLSQAYKNATLLYGRRILRASTRQDSAKAQGNEALVSELLAVIEILKSDATLFKCLLWPTFIAGLECQTEASRGYIIGYLRALWDLTACLNVIGASRLLQEYWQKQDSNDNTEQGGQEIRVIHQGWLLI